MMIRRMVSRVVILVITVLLSHMLDADPACSKELRYAGADGATFAFQINVTVEGPIDLTTYAGVTRYTVDRNDNDQLRLTYRGGLAEATKFKASTSSARPFSAPFGPRGPFGAGRIPSPFAQPTFAGKSPTTNRITMTSRGSVLAMEGDSQLPFLLGNVSLLPFEILPEAEQREWTIDSGVAITQEQEQVHPFRFGPFAQQNQKSLQAASESTHYAIEREDDGNVVIKKTYLMSSPQVGGQPAFEMKGTGSWTYSMTDKLPQALDYRADLIVDHNNTKTTFPITIKLQRLSNQDLAKHDAEIVRLKQEREMKAAEAKQLAAAPLTAVEKETSLTALRSGDSDQVLNALQRLRSKKPVDPDAEVAAAIEALLGNSNRKIQEEACQALVNWSPAYKRKVDLNKAYDSHMPVESTGQKITPATTLYVGQIVQAKLFGPSWYAAEILDLPADGQILVRRRGFAKQDKTVSRTEIQLAPEELAQPHRPISLTPSPGGQPRVWSDASGEFKIEAAFLGVSDGRVNLRRADGREFAVPLDSLSSADQTYVKQSPSSKKNPVNPFK